MMVYDIEIKRAIPPKRGQLVEGIEYCEGWHDHANMGIAVVGTYDFITRQYRVFCEDNLGDLTELISRHECVIGFNNVAFDDKVLGVAGIKIDSNKSYDLLREIWVAAGLYPVYSGVSHNGFSLEAMSQANLKSRKSGNGAMAPVLWQQGQIGSVIDYCLNDVFLTVELIRIVCDQERLIDPRDKTKMLRVCSPDDMIFGA